MHTRTEQIEDLDFTDLQSIGQVLAKKWDESNEKAMGLIHGYHKNAPSAAELDYYIEVMEYDPTLSTAEKVLILVTMGYTYDYVAYEYGYKSKI